MNKSILSLALKIKGLNTKYKNKKKNDPRNTILLQSITKAQLLPGKEDNLPNQFPPE